jgi:UDP-2-acetamido-2,6-beta-L-arabino-hexul-4-ose reductase
MKKKVVITGIVGFMGSHLRDRLAREQDIEVPPFADAYFSQPDKLREVLAGSDTVVHLAAMNRGDENEIYNTNIELVKKLTSALEQIGEKPHILFSSSTQIDKDNPYGRSKKQGAELLEQWSKKNNAPVSILIIPNVFGDSGRPFYNSVIATFCHQITHNEEPTIITDGQVNLIYVNELTDFTTRKVKNPPSGFEIVRIPHTSTVMVSEILELLKKFKDSYYNKKTVPQFKNNFERDIYNTFITYIDSVDFEQKPVVHSDNRGSLFEVVKQQGAGQIFFSTTKLGITRGNHYHTRKMEKFCVVKGQGLIKMRRIGTDKVLEFKVSGDNTSSVEMPIFYTHNITNIGNEELLTLFWTNELFDPNDPDTFYQEV